MDVNLGFVDLNTPLLQKLKKNYYVPQSGGNYNYDPNPVIEYEND